MDIASFAVSLIPGCVGWCSAVLGTAFQVISAIVQGVPPQQLLLAGILTLSSSLSSHVPEFTTFLFKAWKA